MVVVYLSVNTIARDATHVGIIHLAYLVGHELHHLVLNGVPLRVGGHLLHVGAMFTQLLVMLLVGGTPSLGVLRQKPVHHRVGITADGRSKVSVIIKSQTKMADVMDGVFRLHHSPQGYMLYHLLLGLSLGFIHQLVQAASRSALGASTLQTIAELHDKLPQGLQLLRVRIVVDTIRQSLGAFSPCHLAHALRHVAVGQEHELLYQLIGILGTFHIATNRFALFVYIKMQLLGVKLHGTILESFRPQLLGQAVKGNQLVSVLAFIMRPRW